MATWLTVVLVATGTGVLALSVLAKAADWQATSASWPVHGRARIFAGPATITVAELGVVIVAVAPLPATVPLLTIAALFAGYAVAAMKLAGRTCACFGSWLPTRFTGLHAFSCGTFAAACAVTARSPGMTPGSPPVTIAACTGIVVAMLAATTLARTRRATRKDKVAGLPAAHLVDHVVIFTSKTCGFCAALQAQRLTYAAMAGCRLEFREATEPADRQAAGDAFPAAVAYDRDGTAISAPVHGLAGIRDLLRHTQSADAYAVQRR